MDNIKSIATGTVLTLIIGGAAYGISQEDLVNNFAEETGLTQEQAELYVNNVSEEDLDTFTAIGSGLIAEASELSSLEDGIDCENYEYEWESSTLSCYEGKAQIDHIARSTRALGLAYKKLDADTANEEDMAEAIRFIDQLNMNYRLELASVLWDFATLDEAIKTNSYNKALLKAALESE